MVLKSFIQNPWYINLSPMFIIFKVMLIAIAFTTNKPLYLLKARQIQRLNSVFKLLKFVYKRPINAITKIYNIIIFIL
jgi:hypothetical protein